MVEIVDESLPTASEFDRNIMDDIFYNEMITFSNLFFGEPLNKYIPEDQLKIIDSLPKGERAFLLKLYWVCLTRPDFVDFIKWMNDWGEEIGRKNRDF